MCLVDLDNDYNYKIERKTNIFRSSPPPTPRPKVCTVLTWLPLTENYFTILLFPRGELLWWCLFSSDPARWNRRSLRGFRNINPTCILHFVSAKRVKHRAVHKLRSFSGRTVCSGGIRIPRKMDGRYWWLSIRGKTDGWLIHSLRLCERYEAWPWVK